MIDTRPNLLDFSLNELTELCCSLGEKSYRSRQLASWLFRQGVSDFAEMTDIAKSTREKLASQTQIKHPEVLEVAKDSEARKILWQLADGSAVESVLIQEKEHLTLCVSSQVGCSLGCRFCRTAELGFKRNLTPGEILGQIIGAKKLLTADEKLTNIVFMGMGEPLLNLDSLLASLKIITDSDLLAFAKKRISVSTVGIVPALAPLAASKFETGLTISLSAPNDALRDQLMPINRRFPLAMLKKALAAWPLASGRRLSVAYVLLSGVNDSPAHAKELSRYLAGLKVKINLIPFNPWPGAPFTPPDDSVVAEFQELLRAKKYTVIVRWSKGGGLSAACGQLVGAKVGV